MADRLVGYLSCTFNGYDFLFLNDELTRNSHNVIKGNDTCFNFLNPSEVDFLFKISVEQGILVLTGINAVFHSVIENIIRCERSNGILIFKI